MRVISILGNIICFIHKKDVIKVMNKESILKLVERLTTINSESEWLEFKLNNDKPELIGEYISAIANSACLCDRRFGYLIYGVSDSKTIEGSDFDPTSSKVGNENIDAWLFRMIEGVDFAIHVADYNEKKIVLFKIDAAIGRPARFQGKAYVRIGSYKKLLTDYPEKERKIWQRSASVSFETTFATELLDENEILQLLDYETVFKLLEYPLPPTPEGVIQKLLEENFIVNNIETPNKHYITNLGAILLAKDLHRFGHLERKAIRVIMYKGKNKLNAIKDIVGAKGYAVGFEGLINYINELVPAYEEIGKAFRKSVKIYPEIAIRELVANALIHQDFSITGTGPVIEIYEDRMEISNPGKPLIDPLRFLDQNPRSRNEKLAYFMRRANICEERGSGIDKVITATELHELPAPNFISEPTYMKVIVYAKKTWAQMTRDDKIRTCYQHCSLKYLSSDLMTNQSLRKRLNVEEKNYPMISRVIADTINLNLIKTSEPKSKKYVPFWVQ